MKRFLVGLVAVSTLAGVLAGCRGGHRGAAALVPVTGSLPPVTTVPSTTVATLPPVTTTTIDTSQVPAQITVPYVDAVLKVLDHVQGNGARAAVSAHNFTTTTRRDFSAVFTSSLRNNEILSLLQSIQKQYGAFRQPPGDLIVTVRRLIFASASCIYATVNTDYRLLSRVKTAAVNAEFLELVRTSNSSALSLNPTGWVIAFDQVTVTPQPIPNRCPS